ncbi:MAG: Fic family protein [Betaproteobacteria bacterium]
MNTLRLLGQDGLTVPAATAWYLADLGEARGKQELFKRQVPQKLKVLLEHALIESAVSSNRIEGVNIDPKRAWTLVLGGARYRDRNEEEVRGYRDALKLVHETALDLPISEATVRKLHGIARGEVWDAGKYKERDADIIERSATGEERVRFSPVSAAATPKAVAGLVGAWQAALEEERVHPVIAAAGFNFDFLCIHPFRDGNGRVSRLLLVLMCRQLGYDVGRYISLERVIEENKDRYYETLERSSFGWHDARHDPWPYINYLLYVLKSAYQELEARVGEVESPRGAKTQVVLEAISKLGPAFALGELERACPGVSRDMVRRVLRIEQRAGKLTSEGRGPGARWRKRG